MVAFSDDYNLKKLQKIKVRGFPFYITPRYFHHYIQNEYEEFSADLFLSFLKPTSIVVDVGAHYGFYSLIAAKKVGNRGKVYSFEPVDENFEILNKNIKVNQAININSKKIAISDKNTYSKFNVTEASDSAGFYKHPLTKTLKEVKVKTSTIDYYFSDKKVDFIKIDTEGHELQVINGASKTIKKNKDIKLLVELNPDCLRNAGFNPKQLLKLLKQLNFEVFLIKDKERKQFRITDNIKNFERLMSEVNYTNLLCLPKDKTLSALFVSHSSLPAGGEKALVELVEGLQERNVLCHVIFPSKGPIQKELSKNSIGFNIVPFSWWASPKKRVEAEKKREWTNNIIATMDIARLIRDYQPHVVFSNSIVVPWGAFAAAMVGKPHAWMVHEFGEKDHGLKFDLPYNSCLKLLDLFSNVILTNSQAVTDHLIPLINRDKIVKAANLIKVESKKVSSSKNFFNDKKALKLIIVGRVDKSKGQLEAMQATISLIKENLNVELLIVGEVGSKEYLRDIRKQISAAKLKDRIKIVGFQKNPFPAMNQADTLLMCSRNEALGRATVEAMFLKKPVIGSNAGGTPELVSPGVNGFLYKQGDVDDLKDKIKIFYNDRLKIKEFGDRGFKMVSEKFTEKNFTEKVFAILKGLKNKKNFVGDYQVFLASIFSSFEKMFSEKVEDQESEKLALQVELGNVYNSKAWRLASALRSLKHSFFDPFSKKQSK